MSYLFYKSQIVTVFVCTDHITLGHCTRWMLHYILFFHYYYITLWKNVTLLLLKEHMGREHGDAQECSKIYVLKYTECHPPVCRPSFFCQIREGNLKTHGQTWCILDKSNAVWVKEVQWPFYESVQSVAVWCTDDRENHPDFYQNRGLFFSFFSKVDNLQMVTNNKLGKLYGKVEAFWTYSVTLCKVLRLKNQLWR